MFNAKQSILISALAAILISTILISSASAATVIYPYTNLEELGLTPGTVLVSATNPNEVVIIQGDGTHVYIDTSSFKEGIYSTTTNNPVDGLGSYSGSYYIKRPDATIQIQRNGVPGAEIYGKTISAAEYLKIIVTPLDPDFWPYALSIKTSQGGTTTYLGSLDTRVGSPTGLKREGNSLVMITPPLKDIGLASGSFDVAALFDSSVFRPGVPSGFLTGTYYSRQHGGYALSIETPAPTQKPTTAVATPTKTPEVAITQTPTPTHVQNITPTEVPTQAKPTASPAPCAMLLSLLAISAVLALKRR